MPGRSTVGMRTVKTHWRWVNSPPASATPGAAAGQSTARHGTDQHFYRAQNGFKPTGYRAADTEHMRLAEIIALRGTVCAGLLVTMTERCPLSCGHCSSASTLDGRDLDAAQLLAFLATFTAQDRPEVVMLTGGEPMMRPELVAEAAATARVSGARTAVLTGAFFARTGRIPGRIRDTISTLDHFSVSLDAFHEREVPRAEVFALLRLVLDLGVATSLHIVGSNSEDPYLAEVTSAVRATFGTEVPMLVSEVRGIGRGSALATGPPATDVASAAPCSMAAWPVLTPDGVFTACCNQDVVDGRDRPEHLVLGRLGERWQRVRGRATGCGLLRMVRTVGPVHIANRIPLGVPGERDACTACTGLDRHTGSGSWADEVGSGPAGELLERAALAKYAQAGAEGFVRRYGSPRYARLVGDQDRADPVDHQAQIVDGVEVVVLAQRQVGGAEAEQIGGSGR